MFWALFGLNSAAPYHLHPSDLLLDSSLNSEVPLHIALHQPVKFLRLWNLHRLWLFDFAARYANVLQHTLVFLEEIFAFFTQPFRECLGVLERACVG